MAPRNKASQGTAFLAWILLALFLFAAGFFSIYAVRLQQKQSIQQAPPPTISQ